MQLSVAEQLGEREREMTEDCYQETAERPAHATGDKTTLNARSADIQSEKSPLSAGF